MRKLIIMGVLAGLVSAAGGSVWAGMAVVTDRVSYTGSQTQYGSLADALAQTNPIGAPYAMPNRVTAPPYDTPYRDAGFYFLKDANDIYTDFNFFATDWWYSTIGTSRYAGAGNPHSSVGFVQIYDDNSSTDINFNGYFRGPALTAFTLEVSGTNAVAGADVARLWNAAGEPGDGGIFHSYDLDITFGGLSGAWNPGTARYEASNHPTSVSGTFNAIFENTTTAGSFYVVQWTFGMDNWAFGQGAGLVGGPIDPSFFASHDIPEPSAGAMLLLVGAIGWMRRR